MRTPSCPSTCSLLWMSRGTLSVHNLLRFSHFSSGPLNHYDVLSVSRSASASEIKAAFYAKSKQLHPDVNASPHASEQFNAVRQAYEILGDSRAKIEYDALLNNKRNVNVSSTGSSRFYYGPSNSRDERWRERQYSDPDYHRRWRDEMARMRAWQRVNSSSYTRRQTVRDLEEQWKTERLKMFVKARKDRDDQWTRHNHLLNIFFRRLVIMLTYLVLLVSIIDGRWLNKITQPRSPR